MTLANIAAIANAVNTNWSDEERVNTFGKTYFGIAALFLSLASNISATVLVAVRIWYDRSCPVCRCCSQVSRLYRRQVATHARQTNRRTFFERFMELLIDSGIAYTLLWVRLRF